jgi:hypothetical protein
MLTESNSLASYEEFSRATAASAAAGYVDTVGIVYFLKDVCFYVDSPQEVVALSRAIAILKSQEAWLYSGIDGGTV